VIDAVLVPETPEAEKVLPQSDRKTPAESQTSVLTDEAGGVGASTPAEGATPESRTFSSASLEEELLKQINQDAAPLLSKEPAVPEGVVSDQGAPADAAPDAGAGEQAAPAEPSGPTSPENAVPDQGAPEDAAAVAGAGEQVAPAELAGPALQMLYMTCENCTASTGARVVYQQVNMRFCAKCGSPLAYRFHCQKCNSDFSVSREHYLQMNGLKFCPRCGAH
jgi:hypothetical protein